MANFRAVLAELSGAESDLAKMYVTARGLHSDGLLTPEIRAQVHAQRDAVYGAQIQTYDALQTAVLALSPAGGRILAAQIPRPQKMADLPSANLR